MTLGLTDELAIERTRLANERTLLAYVRTGLAIAASGFGVAQFIPGAAAPASGILLMLAGSATLAIGVWRYAKATRALRRLIERHG
jgi:putative membrane protein